MDLKYLKRFFCSYYISLSVPLVNEAVRRWGVMVGIIAM